MNVIINVRNPHRGDTYIARAQGWGTTASSTNSRAVAAERCAEKIAAGRPVSLKAVTSETYLAEITDFGTWIPMGQGWPNHGEWVLAVYRGVYAPRYVRFYWDHPDGGGNSHFGGPQSDNDGKGSQPVTHWMRIPDVPRAEIADKGSGKEATNET